jgi:hypothetical protein
MKIKNLLSACAAALLLIPGLHASAGHETAGQTLSKTSAHHADARQMGEGTRSLPDDAMTAIPATQALPTHKDQPATQPKDARLAAPTAVTAPATAGAADHTPKRAHRQRDDIPQRGSGFGIAALTLGLLAITVGWVYAPFALLAAVLAIIFGGIGMSRKRRGKGMAIAGLTLGLVVLMIYVLFVAILIAIFA